MVSPSIGDQSSAVAEAECYECHQVFKQNRDMSSVFVTPFCKHTLIPSVNCSYSSICAVSLFAIV